MKFSLFYEMQISRPTRETEAQTFRNCLEQALQQCGPAPVVDCSGFKFDLSNDRHCRDTLQRQDAGRDVRRSVAQMNCDICVDQPCHGLETAPNRRFELLPGLNAIIRMTDCREIVT